jgi:hypothetical protein
MSQETESTGVAKIASFKYIKDYVIVTLANGVSGIAGNKTDLPFATMLTLKGQDMLFTYKGEWNGNPRYNLEFAL